MVIICEYNVDDYKVKIDGIPIEDYGRPTGRTVYPSSITQTHKATQRKVMIYLKPIEKVIEFDDDLNNDEIEQEISNQVYDEEDFLHDIEIDYWE